MDIYPACVILIGPRTAYELGSIKPVSLLMNICNLLITFEQSVPTQTVDKVWDVTIPVEIVLVSYFFKLIPNAVSRLFIESNEVPMFAILDK